MGQLMGKHRLLLLRAEARGKIARQADRRTEQAERYWATETIRLDKPHPASKAKGLGQSANSCQKLRISNLPPASTEDEEQAAANPRARGHQQSARRPD
jgi:hypothetical protein